VVKSFEIFSLAVQQDINLNPTAELTKLFDDMERLRVLYASSMGHKTNIRTADFTPVGNQPFTGKPICPPVVLNYKGRLLVESEDYTVAYADNIQLGNARIIIHGIGAFNGRVEYTFVIYRQL
jgi:hypothetical protein